MIVSTIPNLLPCVKERDILVFLALVTEGVGTSDDFLCFVGIPSFLLISSDEQNYYYNSRNTHN